AFFPAYMVIDRHYEILQFSGDTGRYVEPTPGAASFNLFKFLKKELHAAARTAIQQALATRRPVVQDRLIAAVDSHSRIVDLMVAPLAEEGDAGLLVVAFQDHGPLDGGEAAPDAGDQAVVRVQVLEKELRAARMQLQATVDELGTANEELK